VLVNITTSSNTQGTYEYTRQHATCNIPTFIAEWTDQPSPITVNPFNSPSGPGVSISSDPLELFSLFLDGNVIDLIVMETNRYASQCRGDDIWETNVEEIRAYFGFYVLMGINHLPEIRDYRSKDEKLHYSPVADRISRRFEISRYLHFADNTTLPARGEDGYERLQKVQPIITLIRECCLQMFRPGAENSIDEAMIPFKGEWNSNNL